MSIEPFKIGDHIKITLPSISISHVYEISNFHIYKKGHLYFFRGFGEKVCVSVNNDGSATYFPPENFDESYSMYKDVTVEIA